MIHQEGGPNRMIKVGQIRLTESLMLQSANARRQVLPHLPAVCE
jgi:hypothetical protein